MTTAAKLITDNLDIWASAVKVKSSSGRGGGKKVELYGVKKLRELILDLAVRGLLVEQDAGDEPAGVLLEKVAAKKKGLIESGQIKKSKELTPVLEPEKSFELPIGWTWTKLGNLLEMYNGRAFKSSEWEESGLPIVRIQNLNDENASFNYFDGDLADHHRIETGTFLISWSGTPGTSFGAFIWTRGTAALNQHINKCVFHDPNMNINFMRLAINGCMNHFIAMAQGGVGLKHVTKGTLNNGILAIPPAQEQSRIVAKVDELMALCDQLEQQQETSITAHQTLVETLLSALTNASEKGQFDQAWARIAENFDTLFTTEHSIDQLKQTILQLAVMGKLVSQDPDDEPASVLLEKIAAEKEEMVRDGRIKRQKALPEIKEDEKPFELPDGWVFQRLGWLGFDVGGGTPSKSDPALWNGEIPWVTPKDMKMDYISNSIDRITEKAVSKSSAKLIPAGSVLAVVRGMILAHSFPVALTKKAVTVNQDMKAIVFSHISPEFMLQLMKSLKPAVLSLVDRSTHGTCKLSSDKLWNVVVAIPPASEQKRITDKLAQLFGICDSISSEARKLQELRMQIAAGVISWKGLNYDHA